MQSDLFFPIGMPQSLGSQKVREDLVTEQQQPITVLMPLDCGENLAQG